jgi:hypothetical protein
MGKIFPRHQLGMKYISKYFHIRPSRDNSIFVLDKVLMTLLYFLKVLPIPEAVFPLP